MVNTLQRRKEKREPDVNGAAQSGAPAPPEEAQRPRSMTVSAATRVKLSFQIFQFGAKEMAVLAPASTGDALHVVFIWEVLLVWSVGIMQAGGNAPLGTDFHRAVYSKEASVLCPSKRLGSILLDYNGDKL